MGALLVGVGGVRWLSDPSTNPYCGSGRRFRHLLAHEFGDAVVGELMLDDVGGHTELVG